MAISADHFSPFPMTASGPERTLRTPTLTVSAEKAGKAVTSRRALTTTPIMVFLNMVSSFWLVITFLDSLSPGLSFSSPPLQNG